MHRCHTDGGASKCGNGGLGAGSHLPMLPDNVHRNGEMSQRYAERRTNEHSCWQVSQHFLHMFNLYTDKNQIKTEYVAPIGISIQTEKHRKYYTGSAMMKLKNVFHISLCLEKH